MKNIKTYWLKIIRKKYLRHVLIVAGIVILSGFCFAMFLVKKCSPSGYTIALINGMNTSENDARENLQALQRIGDQSFNGEKIDYEYLYNPTHLAGVTDFSDIVNQDLFKETNEYDLGKILDEASAKIKTQKVILVGYSEGNFYVNDLYNNLINKKGGLSSSSVATFAVATPVSHIAGVLHGKENENNYIISDTDKVISTFARSVMNILSPNIHISLQEGDDPLGHSFAGVYVKYQPEFIRRGIRSQLETLQSDIHQNAHQQCIAFSDPTVLSRIEDTIYAITDSVARGTKNVISSIPESFVLTYKKDIELISSLGALLSKNTTYIASDNEQATALLGVSSTPKDNKIVSSEKENQTILSKPAVKITQKPVYSITPQVVPAAPVVNVPLSIQQPSTPPARVVFGGAGGGGVYTNPIIIPPVTPPEATPVTTTTSGQTPVNQTSSNNTDATSSSTTTNITSTSSSNTDTSSQNIVVNKNDGIGPVITIIGEKQITIIKNSTYSDQGATVFDAIDGSVSVVASGTVDLAKVGSYTITYTATDSSGNKTTATRTIIVVKAPPVLIIKGSNSVTIPKNSQYNDEGATATDPVDGSSIVVEVSGTVDVAMPGTYNLTYKATDADGNSTTTIRTVTVTTTEKIGTKRYFDSNNKIYYQGTFVICTIDDHYIGINGDNSRLLPYLSGTNWQTQYEETTNENMAVNQNFRFIFGDYLQDYEDCKNGTYVNDYSDTFHYQTPSGDSFVPDNGKAITAVSVTTSTSTITGTIDNAAHSIVLTVPSDVDRTRLIPAFSFSSKAVITPTADVPQDFTHPIVYTVTAGDGSIETYTVTVVVSEKNPGTTNTSDFTPTNQNSGMSNSGGPSILSYTFNGAASSVIINPIANLETIDLVSSENVNWLSIKIENQNDPTIYKTFQSGVSCVDGTTQCTKIWDGSLSSGDKLLDGAYRIKVHMKDINNNEYQDYLSPYIITVDTSH